jgi:hypothetical protein
LKVSCRVLVVVLKDWLTDTKDTPVVESVDEHGEVHRWTREAIAPVNDDNPPFLDGRE